MLTGHGCDEEAVVQEGRQADAQEELEVQELQLLCVCKCQEGELRDGAAVGPLLSLDTMTHVWKEKQLFL